MQLFSILGLVAHGAIIDFDVYLYNHGKIILYTSFFYN